jgi:HPt (histidine-containing phosphotransfer) domain-containing protein
LRLFARNILLTVSVIGSEHVAAAWPADRSGVTAMPLRQRIEWMPSPPLVPEDGPIDLEHLGRMTLGDAKLERQVLALFLAQTSRLVDAFAGATGDAGALAHTLKGSALAIGAFRLADAAGGLETAVLTGDDPSPAYADLRLAFAEARVAIDAILRRA